jgi:two-component sensor histidine kinase
MREVILNALRAHVDPASSQVTVEGPETVLPAAFALSLSLVVHELATNATKYGSLSADEGRVSIKWTCEGQSVHINWRESGGPPVVAPEYKGFGSLLIERAFPAAARARSAPDYRAQGLVFDLAFELDEPQDDKLERVQ